MLAEIGLQLKSISSASYVLLGVLMGGSLVMLLGMVESSAAMGLLGVIIGSAISSVISFLTARENRRQDWALVGLDRRLEVHQTAYSLWLEIIRNVHNESAIGKVVQEADAWWSKNCLYLDAASRKAFRACLLSASNHSSLLKEPRGEDTTGAMRENWAAIVRLGQTLPAGVALPALGELEAGSTTSDSKFSG